MAVLIMVMAQQNKPNNSNATNITKSSDSQQQLKVKPMLYDFLGMKPSPDCLPVVLAPKPAVSEPSLASVGASSAGGGGRGPISSSSDLASGYENLSLIPSLINLVEKQVGNHLEGVPFYGTRSDVSGPEISNRLAGSKRSNSESGFMGHDYPENMHLMKILRNAAEGEQSKRSKDDEMFYRMQQLRPTSASVMLQPSNISRIDANVSRWERTNPVNVGPAVQYPLRGSQLVPFMHQVPTNRFRDANAGPSIISQSAADEGSRTGIKGPGILNSINAIGGLSEKNSSAPLPGGSKPKSGTVILEPESSTPSRQELTSAGRQMTIFYGGQAHVFDDVHPNKNFILDAIKDKAASFSLLLTSLGPFGFSDGCVRWAMYLSEADVIMALAGSNGGSWSTTYSPKSTVRPVGENFLASGDLEGRVAGNTASPQEFRGRLSVIGNTSHGTSSNDRISTPTGCKGGGGIIAKDTRSPNQGAEPSNEDRR
ncbi:hypothetical protein WN943_000415 [Citrus x changshan-huyou]